MKMPKLFFSILMILLLPVLLVACGDDEPEASDNNATNDQSEDSGSVTLSETFSASEGGINLTFNYPETWVTSAEGGQVALANSQAALDLITTTPIESVELPAESYGLQIAILPAAEMPPDTSPAALLGMLTEGGAEGVTFGSAEEFEVNGSTAAKIPVMYAQSTGEIYILKSGELYLLVSAASPDYSNFEAITQAIVESLQAG